MTPLSRPTRAIDDVFVLLHFAYFVALFGCTQQVISSSIIIIMWLWLHHGQGGCWLVGLLVGWSDDVAGCGGGRAMRDATSTSSDTAVKLVLLWQHACMHNQYSAVNNLQGPTGVCSLCICFSWRPGLHTFARPSCPSPLHARAEILGTVQGRDVCGGMALRTGCVGGVGVATTGRGG